MPRKLKVFGGLTFNNKHKQVRTIVATTTKKRACELLNTTMHEFNNYWCETGNETELKIAIASPETVFTATSTMGKDFIAS